MTGFHRRTFVLEFEDPSFGGLEVRTRSASLADLMRMQELMNLPIGEAGHEHERDELFDRLGGILIGWNLLDDNDEPVPTTPGQLVKEEWPLIRAICRAWVKALIEVPRPLSPSSFDGEALEELHIPMTTLPAALPSSPSQSSSSTPNGSSDSAQDSTASPNPEDS